MIRSWAIWIPLAAVVMTTGDGAWSGTRWETAGHGAQKTQEDSPRRPRSATGPDIILHHAQVITLDGEVPAAQAIAIGGNLILAVGSDEEVLALQMASTELIDLDGRVVVPGLIDDHTHQLKRAYNDSGIEGLRRAAAAMAADGYTTVHEFQECDQGFVDAAAELGERGDLAVRIGVYLNYMGAGGEIHQGNWNSLPYTARIDTMVRVVGVKLFADGGAVNAPCITTLYQDGPAAGTHGDCYFSQAECDSTVSMILGAGYPIAMHAIGDSAVAIGLNAFQHAFAGGGNALRSRMEHLRVMRADLVDQMALVGVAASIQHTWANAYSGSAWESWYLPEVLDWIYPWRRMADRGIPIVVGNDTPYTLCTQAMQSLSLLATRKPASGPVLPSWLDGDQLTVEDGLRAMTVTNAWVTFEEDWKGTITPGKLADLTVLSDDPLAMDPLDVRDITIEMTIMDGVIRHDQIGMVRNAVHDAGTFSMGIDDRGLWGPSRSDVGLLYRGVNHLYLGSVMISYDHATVANGLPRHGDYDTSPAGWLEFQEPGTVADEEATVTYEDTGVDHPGGMQVTQRTLMWAGDPLLLVKYSFTNTGEAPVSDVCFGQLMDLDVGDWTANLGGWDSNQGLGFAYMFDASDPGTPYIGVAMFDSTGNFANRSMAFVDEIDSEGGHEVEFAEAMRSGSIQSTIPEPGNYAVLLASPSFHLDVDASLSPFTLAFVVGESLSDLENAVNLAYERSVNASGSAISQAPMADVFFLNQNRPNPFNPTTTIGYRLPEGARVRLAVYDVSGRLVETLVNERRPAGIHAVRWDASRAGSGVYFYCIEAGGLVDVRKCVVIE